MQAGLGNMVADCRGRWRVTSSDRAAVARSSHRASHADCEPLALIVVVVQNRRSGSPGTLHRPP